MTPATANAELLTLAVLDHEHPTDATPPDGDVRVPPARELHRRVNDGITVVLLWRPDADGVTVTVDDARRHYGVVIDPETMRVDESATARLRSARATV